LEALQQAKGDSEVVLQRVRVAFDTVLLRDNIGA
jgi:hypothetical protein